MSFAFSFFNRFSRSSGEDELEEDEEEEEEEGLGGGDPGSLNLGPVVFAPAAGGAVAGGGGEAAAAPVAAGGWAPTPPAAVGCVAAVAVCVGMFGGAAAEAAETLPFDPSNAFCRASTFASER